MKLAILGTGMIACDVLTILHKFPLESISILGTPSNPEEKRKLVEKFNINALYFDYSELLKSDIDIIYIALPNHLHFSFAKEALLHDKHVIIEKPITSNYQEFCILKDIADSRHLIMIEAMNVHYLPAYRSLKEHIKEIGEIKIISFNYSQYSSRYDAFLQGNILPAFDYHKAGGALMDINIYNLHSIIGLFGKPIHAKYQANIQNQIDTSGVLTMDYGSFKAVCIGAKDCFSPAPSIIQGELGCILIHAPLSQAHAYTVINQNKDEILYEFDTIEHRLYYEFQEFFEMIQEKNFEKANKMLEISGCVSQIMTETRIAQGILFDSDTIL